MVLQHPASDPVESPTPAAKLRRQSKGVADVDGADAGGSSGAEVAEPPGGASVLPEDIRLGGIVSARLSLSHAKAEYQLLWKSTELKPGRKLWFEMVGST